MTRTIAMELVESGEVLLAYGQNGEMLRPENGYPLRLVVPGVQGVSWVKWLRRIEVGDKPYATKDAVSYTHLDVYKRQRWCRGSWRRSQPDCGPDWGRQPGRRRLRQAG